MANNWAELAEKVGIKEAMRIALETPEDQDTPFLTDQTKKTSFPDLATCVQEAKQLTLSEVPFMVIKHGGHGLILEKHGDGIFVLLATMRPLEYRETFNSTSGETVAQTIYHDYEGIIVVDEILMQAVVTGKEGHISIQPTAEAYPSTQLGDQQLKTYQQRVDSYFKPSETYGGISFVEHLIGTGNMVKPTPAEANMLLTRRYTI